MPAWLQADAGVQPRRRGARRLGELERELAGLGATLASLSSAHDLARALGDANRLQWVLQNVHALEAGELLCWITGWSSDPQVGTVTRALSGSGARALPHYATPPADTRAPLLLSNPRWARPFEIFSRAFGMPVVERSRSERCCWRSPCR